ncbi:MAG: dihydrolipoamide acetyltransferase family protein, partial [Candidatus Methanomethyliaceae archaeon]
MIEVVMPKLGLTMEKGTILRWLKAEGEEVRMGTPLFVVETDKAVMEVEAPASGVLGKIVVPEGSTVPVAQVIAYILAPGERPPERWPTPERLAEATSAFCALGSAGERGLRPPAEDVSAKIRSERVIASPRARRLAQERGISLERITGTGPGGRITEEDVLEYARTLESDLIVPSNIRKLTAERMAQSFTSIPHIHLTMEVVCSKLVELRSSLLSMVEEKTGTRLSFTDMLIVLLARVLRKHPLANASWEEGRIRLMRRVNIGVAVATESGLLVPVIKDADKKSLVQVTAERKDLVEKALAGRLSLDEITGGTFTLTNLGMLGIDQFNPIILPPQSASLAV